MYQKTANAYNAYYDNSINTATPQKLTLMLYEGAVKFCRFAEIAIEENNVTLRHNNLLKAQNIVRELIVTLNHDAGEIAEQFLLLYEFIQRQLMEANIENNVDKVKIAREMLEEFAKTWSEIV